MSLRGLPSGSLGEQGEALREEIVCPPVVVGIAALGALAFQIGDLGAHVRVRCRRRGPELAEHLLAGNWVPGGVGDGDPGNAPGLAAGRRRGGAGEGIGEGGQRCVDIFLLRRPVAEGGERLIGRGIDPAPMSRLFGRSVGSSLSQSVSRSVMRVSAAVRSPVSAILFTSVTIS